MPNDLKREFLRHTLATLAYRAGKTLLDAPETFATFRLGVKTRTPAEILAHMGDLLDWALSLAKEKEKWRDSKPLPWDEEVTRFFAALEALDAFLASSEQLGAPVEKLFQGPLADALTTTGKIAMLRRLAGAAVKGENYFKAEILAGSVSPEQARPVREFD